MILTTGRAETIQTKGVSSADSPATALARDCLELFRAFLARLERQQKLLTHTMDDSQNTVEEPKQDTNGYILLNSKSTTVISASPYISSTMHDFSLVEAFVPTNGVNGVNGRRVRRLADHEYLFLFSSFDFFFLYPLPHLLFSSFICPPQFHTLSTLLTALHLDPPDLSLLASSFPAHTPPSPVYHFVFLTAQLDLACMQTFVHAYIQASWLFLLMQGYRPILVNGLSVDLSTHPLIRLLNLLLPHHTHHLPIFRPSTPPPPVL